MKKSLKHKSDRFLLLLIVSLMSIGFFVLASASLYKSQKHFQESYHYLTQQFIFGALIGALFFYLGFKIKYIFWRKIVIVLFLVSLVALFLLFLPNLGVEYGGARRWIDVGGRTFQPSEFVKIFFIMYVAAWLSSRSKTINSISKTVIPFIVLNGFIGILFLLQPDMGSLLIIYVCSGLLFVLSGLNFKIVAILLIIGVVLGFVLVISSSYRLPRLLSFLSPESDPLGSSYQLRQALIGIGAGGVFGQGYGQSIQKAGYLPEVIGDSIFVILVEELGIVGGVSLLIIFLAITFRGFRIAKMAPDQFSGLLAIGITLLFVCQALINIMAISGLLPLTGLTLPLVSHGSSSYIATLFGLGVLMNISTYRS